MMGMRSRRGESVFGKEEGIFGWTDWVYIMNILGKDGMGFVEENGGNEDR